MSPPASMTSLPPPSPRGRDAFRRTGSGIPAPPSRNTPAPTTVKRKRASSMDAAGSAGSSASSCACQGLLVRNGDAVLRAAKRQKRTAEDKDPHCDLVPDLKTKLDDWRCEMRLMFAAAAIRAEPLFQRTPKMHQKFIQIEQFLDTPESFRKTTLSRLLHHIVNNANGTPEHGKCDRLLHVWWLFVGWIPFLYAASPPANGASHNTAVTELSAEVDDSADITLVEEMLRTHSGDSTDATLAETAPAKSSLSTSWEIEAMQALALELAALRQAHEELAEDRERLQRENSELAQERQELEDALAEAEEDAGGVECERDELQEQYDILEAERDTMLSDRRELLAARLVERRKLHDAEAGRRAIEQEHAALRAVHERLAQERDRARHDANELAQGQHELEEALATAGEDTAEAQMELEELREEHENLEFEQIGLLADKTRAERRSKRLRREYNAAIAARDAAHLKSDGLQRDIRGLQQANGTLQSERDVLRRNQETLLEELETARSDRDRFYQQLTQASASRDAAHARVAAAEAERDAAREGAAGPRGGLDPAPPSLCAPGPPPAPGQHAEGSPSRSLEVHAPGGVRIVIDFGANSSQS